MKITDSFPLAIRTLKSNPLRSFLTTLGVIIGVFIVITMVSFGDGAKRYIFNQMSSMGIGANTLAIFGSDSTDDGPFGALSSLMGSSSIDFRDVEAVKDKIKNVELVAPAIFSMASIRHGRQKYDATFVIGTTEEFGKMVPNLVTGGRMINSVDVANRRKVAFIGQTLAKDIFGAFPPIGNEIKINGKPFRIIGLMKEMNKMMGMDFNEMVLIPVTLGEDVLKSKEITETWVKATDITQVPKIKKDIEAILLQRHGKKDFHVRVATDMIDRIMSVMGAVTVAVSFVAAISLLVGSIGIMNIMLVSVAERVKEIGIRKSVGARSRDIFWQFVLEAIIISSIGGISGVLLGTVVLYLIGLGIGLSLIPSVTAIYVSLFVSATVGLVSGVYPAMKAARLDPVDALRG
ncbi:MAG: ABC transporter permease [bacterium]